MVVCDPPDANEHKTQYVAEKFWRHRQQAVFQSGRNMLVLRLGNMNFQYEKVMMIAKTPSLNASIREVDISPTLKILGNRLCRLFLYSAMVVRSTLWLGVRNGPRPCLTTVGRRLHTFSGHFEGNGLEVRTPRQVEQSAPM